jgi:hypothetical protein
MNVFPNDKRISDDRSRNELGMLSTAHDRIYLILMVGHGGRHLIFLSIMRRSALTMAHLRSLFLAILLVAEHPARLCPPITPYVPILRWPPGESGKSRRLHSHAPPGTKYKSEYIPLVTPALARIHSVLDWLFWDLRASCLIREPPPSSLPSLVVFEPVCPCHLCPSPYNLLHTRHRHSRPVNSTTSLLSVTQGSMNSEFMVCQILLYCCCSHNTAVALIYLFIQCLV